MSEAKPFASLSSGLLARKGAAKPAMRRPNANINPASVEENGQDDLGWNDMGYDVNPDISREVPVEKSFNPLAKAVAIPKPEVKQQQERIAAQLSLSHENEEPETLDNKISDSDATHVHSAAKQESKLLADKPTLVQKQPEKPVLETKAKVARKHQNTSKKTKIKKAKAAFTLRLDPERHLKLRLACAIHNVSAQKFVTDALDRKLSEMNQIDHLTGQIVEKR